MMIWYVVIGILLFAMLIYIVLRRPVWIKQVTYTSKEIYVCSNCGEIWTPHYYSDYQLELTPPKKCPHCHREMRM